MCPARRGGIGSYGFISVDDPPGLWGGYSEYLYIPPKVNVHKIDESIEPAIATLFNPIGAGFRWAVDMPRLQPGETIVILGPGQRGLGSVIAARECGASRIIVTGLERDAAKLALAREFGADVTLVADRDDVRTAVREATGGPRRRRRHRRHRLRHAGRHPGDRPRPTRRARRPRRHEGPRQPGRRTSSATGSS